MNHNIRIRFLIAFVGIFIVVFGNHNKADAYGECSQYGHMATYDYLSDSCKCMSGYVFNDNYLGNSTCVSGSSVCYDKYGYGSEYDSLSGSCECSYGYVLGKDSIGRTQCISETESCQDQYGYNSRSTYGGKCECSYGYVFNSNNQCEYGNTVCSRKHGTYSSYDSSSNSCECDSGYTLDDDGQCVEKQNNTYFTLLDIDESSDSIIVQSDYSKQNYLLEYGIGCGLYIDNYLYKKLVINLGTDFAIDIFDKIILPNHNSTCSITSYELTFEESFDEQEELYTYSSPSVTIPPTNNNTLTTKTEPEPAINEIVQEEQETQMSESADIQQVEYATNLEPVKKLKWWQKIFNWFR